jgi:hypothetical protein
VQGLISDLAQGKLSKKKIRCLNKTDSISLEGLTHKRQSNKIQNLIEILGDLVPLFRKRKRLNRVS